MLAYLSPRTTLVAALLLLLSACATPIPKNTANVCSIFEEHRDWYKAAKKAEKRWSSPIAVSMAIIHQESSFEQKARPPRRYYLGFIPGRRPSNAYGYAQALDGTWDQYRDEAGNWGARRTSFKDAVDFIGWYNNSSMRLNRIRRDDAYNLYLAYHEGNGGFSRKTYNNKGWLKNAAANVQSNSERYQAQLQGCEKNLNRSWLMRLLF